MIPRIVSIVASFSVLFFSCARGQLLTRDTASGDSQAQFRKRLQLRDDDMASKIFEAEKVGWNLYRYSILSDLAGFALAEQTQAEQRRIIVGEITVHNGDDWRVRFYGAGSDGSFVPVADVIFDADCNAKVETGASLLQFTPGELAMIKGRELVLAQKADPCESNYKVITIPSPAGGNVWVYQLRVSFDESHVPEGQHLRFEISPDGTQILSQREYSRRCNVLPIQKNDEGNNEIKLTNTMDSQPTEIYVYLSLRYDSGIFLATMQSNLYWMVKNGEVTQD